MSRDLSALKNKKFDLLIVGGGINGAATANMASFAGLKVALIEKGDFASGASSKSSKLLHGGIRYLEQGEFSLVKEALRERFGQLKSAPYLTKPLAFMIPVYRNSPRPLWMLRFGVWLYDALSGRYSFGRHRSLTPKQVLEQAPDLDPDGLVGGVMYYDAQMNDARLCLENALMAKARGASIVNYASVQEFLKENGRAIGVKVRDEKTGSHFDVMAKTIIVTAGPWTEDVLRRDNFRHKPFVRTTKGVHIVIRKRISDTALVMQHPEDGRIFFVMPWYGHTLIGTTDTDYKKSPDDVAVDPADIEYLLKQTRQYFKGIDFTEQDIITSFAGLRPLVYQSGLASLVSRRHLIKRAVSGVYYLAGGKYTTYRPMVLECLRVAFPLLTRKFDHLTGTYPLFGNMFDLDDTKTLSMRYGMSGTTVDYLRSLYGCRTLDVLKLTIVDPSLKGVLCPCSPAIRAQIVYALTVEAATTANDVFYRRLQLQYTDCNHRQCRSVIEEICRDLGHE